ncbi:PREDICTED: uncharacterized protein LOC104590375 isoform X1 [Nelumbo nucifera]|uniref:Uncharacterized protein LOC104590375 isoform X1 n=1 Tax=Nelumbo nucifera TaxID=4432 RepID=A0A1U7Z2G5_NELNU|nr:PREDICTED: uncharacterized protein LOC104590375 isoform X1 [Nelumbo nucifera]
MCSCRFQVSKVVWKLLLTKCIELRYSKAYIYEPIAYGKGRRRYTHYSKVDSFLKICQILGLTSIDLFSPSDVVEKRDTRRVCLCIRSLSKKARSKNLNVPDFDIVTYTIAMPTDMVGFIRRSLEQSQCSSSSFVRRSPHLDSTINHRQKNWGVDYIRQCDSYSEDSDDAESNFREFVVHSPDSEALCDSASLLIPSLENSPRGSSVIAENCILSGADHRAKISYCGFNKGGKDRTITIYRDASFNESTSVPRLGCGFGRGLSDEIENADLSPTICVKCFPSNVEDTDFKAQFDAKDGCKIPFFEHQNLEIDHVNKSSMSGHESWDTIEHHVLVDDLTLSSDRALVSVASECFGSSTKSCTQIPDQQLYFHSGDEHYVSFHDHIVSMSHTDLDVVEVNTFELLANSNDCLNDKGTLRNACRVQLNGLLSGQSNAPSSAQIKWTDELRCSLVKISNGTHSFSDSSKPVPSHSVYPNKASAEALRLNDANLITFDAMNEVSSSTIKETGVDTMNNLMNYLSTSYFHNSTGVTCKVLNEETIAARWNEMNRTPVLLGCANSGDLQYPNTVDYSYFNGVMNHNSFSASSKPVPSHNVYPNRSSAEDLRLNDADFISSDAINVVSISTLKEPGVDTMNLINYFSTAYFHNSAEVACKELNAETIAARGNEKSRTSIPLGGANGGDLQHPNSVNYFYCNGVETYDTEGHPEAGIVIIREECPEHLLAGDGLNYFLKQSTGEGLGCKSTSASRTVLNSFSSGLKRAESFVGFITYLSLEPSHYPQVNLPSIVDGGTDVQEMPNAYKALISHSQHCHRNPLLADISVQSLVMLQTGLDALEGKNIPSKSGDSPFEFSKSCFYLQTKEIQDSSDQDTCRVNIINVGEPSFHKNGVVPVTLCIPSSEKLQYSTPSCSGNIDESQNDQLLIRNDLQVVDPTCTNEENGAYFTEIQDIQDSSDQDTCRTNIIGVDKPSFHKNGVDPVTLCIPSTEKLQYSTPSCSRNIDESQSDQLLINNDLQVVDQTCKNQENDAYFTEIQDIQDSSDQDTCRANIIDVDEPSFNENDVSVTLCIPSSQKLQYSTPSCSGNIDESQNDQLLISNDLQVVDQTCTNQEIDAYFTKIIDKDKALYGILDMKATENLERGVDEASAVRAKNKKLNKKLMLRSVAGGITLFGALFLLLHSRRKNSRDKFDETSLPSTQIQKTSCREVLKQKQQQRTGVNGVYPGEKLKI